jgi:uncharacterized membrane protein (UPF0127 family)
MIVKIKNNEFKSKVLLDKKSQMKGMMGKVFDDDFQGLLFLMDLDIIIIKDNIITKIHHDCPPCEEDDCMSYCGPGNVVFEVQGGTCWDLDINEGDRVDYVIR